MDNNLEQHELVFQSLLSSFILAENDGVEGLINRIDFTDLPDDSDDFANDEWDNLVAKYFPIDENDSEYDFYEFHKCLLDNFKSSELLDFLRKANEFYRELEDDVSLKCNRETWNMIAFWAFVTEIGYEFQTNFRNLVIKEFETRRKETNERKHRLECNICFEAKQIHVCCSFCKGKLFCKSCYNKLNNKCPFCREKMQENDKKARKFDIYRCEKNPINWYYIKSEHKEKWIENTERICEEIRGKHINLAEF